MVIKKIAPFPSMLFLWPKEYFNCVCYSAAHTMRWYIIYVILCFWCYVVDPYITCHLSVALFFLPSDKIFGLLYTHTHHHPAPNCLEPPVRKKKTSNPETESSTRSPQQRTLAVLDGHWQMAWSMLLLNVFSIPRWAKASGTRPAFHQWQPSSYEKLTYRTTNKASIIMKRISPSEKHNNFNNSSS